MPLILTQPGIFEMEEKRSRFIGHCAPVDTEAAARAFVAEVSARHKTANHNVFAYALTEGNIVRASDDGEPHGTAGIPVLNVFQKGDVVSSSASHTGRPAGVENFACVVTRYFGGTLLGTGGLVRAYSQAAKGALAAALPREHIPMAEFFVRCAYPQYDKMKYHFAQLGVTVVDMQFTQHCEGRVCLPAADIPQFLKPEIFTAKEIPWKS